MYQVVIHYKSCICGQGPACDYRCAAQSEKKVYFQSNEKWLAGAAFEKLKDDFSRSVSYLDQQGKIWIHAIGKECAAPNEQDFIDYFESPFESHDSILV